MARRLVAVRPFCLFQIVHVAVSVGFDPILVCFDRESPDEAQAAVFVEENADDEGGSLDLLVDASEHIGRFHILRPKLNSAGGTYRERRAVNI